jgi:enoyl-CoA hydratase/carnithine racemase
MTGKLGPFRVEVDEGVAVATLDRPPVNAFDLATYASLGDLTDLVATSDDIKVLVLTAPESARCWCGGADLHDFVGMDTARRKKRYEHINAIVPRFAALPKPVIAAITGHTIGIGMVLAAACDLRIASRDAAFATPEVDYGLVSGSSKLLNYDGLPEALIREMAFTGRRVPAHRLLSAGFLNEVVPGAAVLPAAMDLARAVASKSLPVLMARKQAFVGQEQLGWLDAYKLAQGLSGELVALRDAGEGVQAFFDERAASISDA